MAHVTSKKRDRRKRLFSSTAMGSKVGDHHVAMNTCSLPWSSLEHGSHVTSLEEVQKLIVPSRGWNVGLWLTPYHGYHETFVPLDKHAGSPQYKQFARA